MSYAIESILISSIGTVLTRLPFSPSGSNKKNRMVPEIEETEEESGKKPRACSERAVRSDLECLTNGKLTVFVCEETEEESGKKPHACSERAVHSDLEGLTSGKLTVFVCVSQSRPHPFHRNPTALPFARHQPGRTSELASPAAWQLRIYSVRSVHRLRPSGSRWWRRRHGSLERGRYGVEAWMRRRHPSEG
jgi:hypothetical protein